MKQQALRADFLMLLAAMIWGASFVAQQVGMEHIGPLLFTGTRMLLGALVLLPLLRLRRAGRSHDFTRRDLWLGGTLMGLALALGSNLQQVGLLFTSVTNSGFITGLYVIIVPLLGLFFGQRSHLGIWLGASLAVVGMFLLSVGEGFSVASGDWLQLAGAFVWASHVLLIGYFARRCDPIGLSIIQCLVCALISLILAPFFEPLSWDGLSKALPSLLFAGVASVGIAYTLQVFAQRHAIASHAAIILSLEAVFAAIAGALMLDEALGLRGYIGCALMLGGMLVAQLWPNKRLPSPPTPLPQAGEGS